MLIQMIRGIQEVEANRPVHGGHDVMVVQRSSYPLGTMGKHFPIPYQILGKAHEFDAVRPVLRHFAYADINVTCISRKAAQRNS